MNRLQKLAELLETKDGKVNPFMIAADSCVCDFELGGEKEACCEGPVDATTCAKCWMEKYSEDTEGSREVTDVQVKFRWTCPACEKKHNTFVLPSKCSKCKKELNWSKTVKQLRVGDFEINVVSKS